MNPPTGSLVRLLSSQQGCPLGHAFDKTCQSFNYWRMRAFLGSFLKRESHHHSRPDSKNSQACIGQHAYLTASTFTPIIPAVSPAPKSTHGCDANDTSSRKDQVTRFVTAGAKAGLADQEHEQQSNYRRSGHSEPQERRTRLDVLTVPRLLIFPCLALRRHHWPLPWIEPRRPPCEGVLCLAALQRPRAPWWRP